MTIDATLLILMGALFAGSIYLVMDKTLTRIMLGLVMFTNGANLLIILMAGPAGLPPIVRDHVAPGEYSDPLPQALTLTAIVISFATTAFLLAMIYRSWVLARRDEVQIDAEDVKVAEQPSFDAEDDAELVQEDSEFLEEHEDPNADYEHATEDNPTGVTPEVDAEKDQTAQTRGGGRR